jgi:hypothetical protein
MSAPSTLAISPTYKASPSVKSAVTTAIKREHGYFPRLKAVRAILSRVMPAEQAKHLARKHLQSVTGAY